MSECGVNTNLTKEEKEELLEFIFSHDKMKRSAVFEMNYAFLESTKGESFEHVVRMLVNYLYIGILDDIVKKVGTKLDWIDLSGWNLCSYVYYWCDEWGARDRLLFLERLHAAGFDCFLKDHRGKNMGDYLEDELENEEYPSIEDFELKVKTLRKIGYDFEDTLLYDIEERYI